MESLLVRGGVFNVLLCWLSMGSKIEFVDIPNIFKHLDG
jgi:hypothetical protein